MTVLTTPEQIDAARLLALRAMLKLEILGMSRSKSPTAYSILKKEYGCKGTREKVPWNTSKVITMRNMFDGALVFNKNISNWNTGNVTDMNYMFRDARVFNQDLSKWWVARIPYQPTEFSLRAFQWTLPKPVWGRLFVDIKSTATMGVTV